jgi:two-component system, OmpR family, sensor histidine kinase KdpD
VGLLTYVGSAPGVGKSYAMYTEGRRRAEAGQRVVVGWAERHGREDTRAAAEELRRIEPKSVEYRGRPFQEVDVEAIIADLPDVVLVDELAHSYPDGSRQRWQDVADLLAAGLDVITNLNVANLLSVREYAAELTGAGTVAFVPDEFVRAGEIVLIDLPPEVLRRRIASGRVYSAENVGGALANYFRTANLAALGELARAWIAENVDEVGRDLLSSRGLTHEPSRPVVVAAVSGSAWSETVLRKAIDLAAEDDADLLAVHVNLSDGLRKGPAAGLDRYRTMTRQAGGSFVELDGANPASVLAEAARANGASRVVVARHRGIIGELLRGSVASRVRRLLPDVAVTVIGRADTPHDDEPAVTVDAGAD